MFPPRAPIPPPCSGRSMPRWRTVERVERLMSFHDADSELSRLNRNAGRTPQTVHPWTWAVLRRALRIAEASDGLFDITVAPLLVREGLLPGTAETSLQCGNWRHIVLMPDCRVFLARPMLLDLGGIAKGFAVDRAIHELTRRRCTQGVVNAGGDLRRFGSPRPADPSAPPRRVGARGRTALRRACHLRPTCRARRASRTAARQYLRSARAPGVEGKWGGDGRSAELRDCRRAHQGRGARGSRMRAVVGALWRPGVMGHRSGIR